MSTETSLVEAASTVGASVNGLPTPGGPCCLPWHWRSRFLGSASSAQRALPCPARQQPLSRPLSPMLLYAHEGDIPAMVNLHEVPVAAGCRRAVSLAVVLFRGPWRTQEGLPLGRTGRMLKLGGWSLAGAGGCTRHGGGNPLGWAGLNLSPLQSHVQALANGCDVQARGGAGKVR